MTIKKAVTADAVAIAQLEKKCFSLPWSEAVVAETINSSDYYVNVAMHGENLCAYAIMNMVFGEGTLCRIAVENSMRRQGIAQLLLSDLFNYAAQCELASITLEVRQSSLAAIKLYEKNGFVRVGERQNYYKNPTENAVLMTVYRR